MGVNLVVERNRLKDVEKLALVLMNALDLNVEERTRIDLDEKPVGDDLRERFLVRMPDGGVLFLEAGIVRVLFQAL